MTVIPWKMRYVLGCLRNTSDLRSAIRFMIRRDLQVSFKERLRFVLRIYRISLRVWCAHTQKEIIEVATAVLKIPNEVKGAVVEAGCYKGGSTAKLSLVARLSDRPLIAFDSFEGLPENDESSQVSIFGEVPNFSRGIYSGSFEEVTANVRRYGDIERCIFFSGWFEETMPRFQNDIVVAFLDVDLVSSTRTCLKYLFPRLQPGGVIFSQDGHLPHIIKLLDDDRFWEEEIGRKKPPIEGLHKQKLVRLTNQPS